jgi:hypothetical protein
MTRVFELPEPRNSHVVDIRTRATIRARRRHPSVAPFDQEDPNVNAADRCVLLTRIEAQLIASLLNSAKRHLPSPKACQEAIDLLMGKR